MPTCPVRSWRKAKRLTLANLAVMSGLSFSEITVLDAGGRLNLSPRLLAAVERIDGKEGAQRLEASYLAWRQEMAGEATAAAR